MYHSERVTRGNLPHWYKPGHAHFVTYRLAGTIPLEKLREWRRERDRRIRTGVADAASIRPPGAAENDAGSVGYGLKHAGIRRARELAHKWFFARYDDYLDRHASVRWLQQPDVADVVRENLYHHHGERYQLLAWCVMPNHVHVVLQPLETSTEFITEDVGDVGCVQRPIDAGSVGYDCRETDAGSVGYVGDAASIPADAAGIGYGWFSDEVAGRGSVLTRVMHGMKSYTANCANRILGREGEFWQTESYDHWIRDQGELERIVHYVRMNPVQAGLCAEPEQWRFSSAFDRFKRDGSPCALVSWLRDDWK